MKITHEEETLNNIETTLNNINTISDAQQALRGRSDTIINNQTNGSQIVKVFGLSTDGSQEQIGTDNNNNVKCNVINAVNVLPHNSSNGELTPTNSFNVKVSNTANMKLEDLSSSLNGDNNSVSRSIAVSIKGRTDPTTSSGVFLKASSGGNLETINNFDRGNHTTYLNNVGFTSNQEHTSSIDLEGYKGIVIYGSALNSNNFFIAGSGDNTSFFRDSLNNVIPDSSINNEFVKSFTNLPRYIKLINGSSTNTITLHYQLIR